MERKPKLAGVLGLSAFCLLALLSFIGCLPMQEQGSQPEPPIHNRLGKVKQAVVGGKVDNSQPAVGAMVMKSGKRTFCTGTLIGTRLVITAAHCATRGSSSVQFRIDRPSGSSFKPEYYDITQQIRHPQYGRTSRGSIVNDVAVAILSKDVKGITPMPINTQAMTNVWVNRKIFFIGYGLIQTTPQRRSPNRKYSAEITLRRLSSDRFETRDTGKSICSGDSGGPALYKLNNRWTLIGVNSYVTGRSAGGQPYCDGSGWDFRVDAYVSWLQPYLSKHGGKCSSDADCGGCYTCDKASGKCQPKVVVKTAQFCTPCQNSTLPGGTCGNGGACQPLSGGYRCLQPCDANRCCPQGSACQKVNGKDQCVPDKSVCPAWKCSTNKDCGPGESCQGGQCKPAPVAPAATLCKKCNSDADCGGGKCRTFSEGKYCTQACNNGLFCPNGYKCSDVSGSKQCLPTSGICACKTNTDCYNGLACSRGRCVRQGGGKYGDVCDSRRPCAQGYQCVQSSNGTSTCYQACSGTYPNGAPGSACQSGGRCQSGSRCYGVQGVGNLCFKTCNSNNDCADGGTCSSIGGIRICRCTADNQCKNGATCNRERVSQFGQCAKKATNTVKCSSGFQCQSTGAAGYLCVPGATQRAGESCDSTRRCQSGMVCARTDRGNSVCIRQCSNDSSCAKEGGRCVSSGSFRFCSCNNTGCSPNHTCKSISSRNKVCSPGPCKADSDCGNNEICSNGRCQPKPGCNNHSECNSGEKCINGKCQKDGGLGCINDADCGNPNLRCDNNKCVPKSPPPCKDDSACNPDEKCESGKCVPKATGGCKTDQDCQPKDRCVNDKCVLREGFCSTDADCPAGYACGKNDRCLPPAEKPDNTEPTPDAGVTDKTTTTDKSRGKDLKQLPTGNDGCGCTVSATSNEWPLTLFFFLLLPLFWRRRR